MKYWERARYKGRESEDCDVTKERLRVEANTDPITSKRVMGCDDVVTVNNLTKFYNWKKVLKIRKHFTFKHVSYRR